LKFLIFALFLSNIVFANEVYTEGIVKKDLRLKPDALVNEYVKRDANGEFLQTNQWWNSAVACPACMGGPDTFTVISSYDINKLDDLTYSVVYKIEGDLSGDTFSPRKNTESRTFDVVKTSWGYKINGKAYQMVKANVAFDKYKSQLNKHSLEILKAIATKKSVK
jgi:hypothetical protein